MVKISHKAGMVTFSLACIIRHYTYVATLDGKTGRVRDIAAGCRKWKNFEVAREHYNSAVHGWSDAHVGVRVGYIEGNAVQIIARPRRYAERMEAYSVLNRLNDAITIYKAKVREVRKAAKPAVKKVTKKRPKK